MSDNGSVQTRQTTGYCLRCGTSDWYCNKRYAATGAPCCESCCHSEDPT